MSSLDNQINNLVFRLNSLFPDQFQSPENVAETIVNYARQTQQNHSIPELYLNTISYNKLQNATLNAQDISLKLLSISQGLSNTKVNSAILDTARELTRLKERKQRLLNYFDTDKILSLKQRKQIFDYLPVLFGMKDILIKESLKKLESPQRYINTFEKMCESYRD